MIAVFEHLLRDAGIEPLGRFYLGLSTGADFGDGGFCLLPLFFAGLDLVGDFVGFADVARCLPAIQPDSLVVIAPILALDPRHKVVDVWRS